MTSTMGYHGAAMIGEDGKSLGKVSDVIFDDIDPTEPTWLIVNPGFLRAEHYVPAAGSYRTANDDIVVPYTADEVKSAPKARSDHVLTTEDRERLVEHYHLDGHLDG